jgi:hypothetical protein
MVGGGRRPETWLSFFSAGLLTGISLYIHAYGYGMYMWDDSNLWWGLSQNTRKTYNTARRSYTTYCALNEPRRPPFPVTAPLICNWVASLGGRVKPATMKSYITGLRSLHIDMGLPTDGIFDHPRLQKGKEAGIARWGIDSFETKVRLPHLQSQCISCLETVSGIRW